MNPFDPDDEEFPPVLFLDVDGVLSLGGHHNPDIRPDRVALLAGIVKASGCRVVISSTWRNVPDRMARLTEVLSAAGIPVGGQTPALNRKLSSGKWTVTPRGEEIDYWLMFNGRPDRIVILDDNEITGPLMEFLVRTDPARGLTRELAAECVRRLSAG